VHFAKFWSDTEPIITHENPLANYRYVEVDVKSVLRHLVRRYHNSDGGLKLKSVRFSGFPSFARCSSAIRRKYLIKIVLPDGEWCREFTAYQTFGDVRRALKEAAVILNKRFWFTINKVFFRDRFLFACPFFAKPERPITVQSLIIVCRLMISKCQHTLRVRCD
jgi:hypothetical protein